MENQKTTMFKQELKNMFFNMLEILAPVLVVLFTIGLLHLILWLTIPIALIIGGSIAFVVGFIALFQKKWRNE